MLFKKKPVVIDAVRFEDSVECFDKLQELGLDPVRVGYDVSPPVLRIDTPEGEMTAQLGDYIIKGVIGEFYPCKPDIFDKTYVKMNMYQTEHLSFGEAFGFIRKHEGAYMRLPAWKPDVKIKVKSPHEGSDMSAPYLYVCSRFGTVPWKETMIELFSEDWEVGWEVGEDA